jgi:hypothetical protein
MAKTLHKSVPKESAVLSKAVGNAANYWGMSNKQLSEVIGVSEASISRLKTGDFFLDQDSKPGELAIVFLRVFRGLDAFMGGDVKNERKWLEADNSALGGVPLELMSKVEGLTSVVRYVDYMRGQ